ncbi:MAG TPA: hypothetical protein VKB40_05680, partial [Candidatus Acidoferrales bacterium]|nr:hypothetical protein [Candidatus Acidoferrales bacterium]
LRLPARYGDPEGAAKHVKESMALDGTWMIVEPFAHDKLETSQSDRARLLRGFDNAVHPGFAFAGSGVGALGRRRGKGGFRRY